MCRKFLLKSGALSALSFIAISNSYANVPYIVEGTLKTGNNRSYVQGYAFLPVMQAVDNVIFGDVRYMRHLPSLGKKKNTLYKTDTFEANFGLGYRFALKNDLVIGLSSYYDIRSAKIAKDNFKQVTIGAQILTPSWHFHVNGYIPVGKKEKTINKKEFSGDVLVRNSDVYFIHNNISLKEKASSGADLLVSSTIPSMNSVRVGALFYHFRSYKNITGGGIKAKWTVNDNISIEGSYTYDKVRKSNFMLGANFTLSSHKVKRKSVHDLFSTRVERDIDIVTGDFASLNQEEEFKPNLVALSKNTFTDFNNAANVAENVNDIVKLIVAGQEGKDIILVDDAGLNKRNKLDKAIRITAEEYAVELRKEVDNVKTQLNAGQTALNILNDSLNNKDTSKRQIRVLATQIAVQELNGNPSTQFFVGGNTVDVRNDLLNYSRSTILRDIYENPVYKKYAYSSPTSGTTYMVNLPGYANPMPVKRGGAIILTKHEGETYALVGKAGTQAAMWLSGGAETKDENIIGTIKREVFEESSGAIALSEQEIDDAIKQGNFTYSPNKKILAIIITDPQGKYNVDRLNIYKDAVAADTKAARAMKEITDYHMISADNIVQRFNALNRAFINRGVAFNITGSFLQANPQLNGAFHHARQILDNNGNSIRVNAHYAQTLFVPSGVAAIQRMLTQF